MVDRQVFIGNLCNISTDALRTYCETYGPLTEVSLNRDKENNVYHCFAFVTFQFIRSMSQFMSNRPHFICGEEVFVKRTLPRATSSVPERLIVTNRLVLEDFHKYNKHHIRNYFQKFGVIKRIDTENGFIDYEDYDNVDCVLFARPHYIRDKEILVTKFIPPEQQDDVDNWYFRTNYHRSNVNHNRRHFNYDDEHHNIVKTSMDSAKTLCNKHLKTNQSDIDLTEQKYDNDDINNDNDNSGSEKLNFNHLNYRYERLEEKFEQYKKAKELEICALRMDLERTKRQLADITQEKLDTLIKNQKLFHNELKHGLSLDNTLSHIQTNEDFSPSSPNQLTKKRKLTTSLHREYDYYS